MIDLFNTNRSAYRIACYFELVDDNNENIIRSSKTKGKFFARIITPIQASSNVVGSGFYVNNKFITIETCDNIREIVENFNGGITYKIIIPNLGKSYLITDTQVIYDDDNLEMQNEKNAKRNTIISLSEIRND